MVTKIKTENLDQEGEIIVVCNTREEFLVEKDKHHGIVVYGPDEIKILKGCDRDKLNWLHEGKRALGGEIVDINRLPVKKKMTIAEKIRERKNNRKQDTKVSEQPPGV